MSRLAAAIVLLLSWGTGSWAQPTVGPVPGYEGLAKDLTSFLEQECTAKQLPALSIALVDGDRLVWARGFGMADPVQKVPASAETVYRAGSVSKLFTALAVMQQVERERLDLDAPITRYLPTVRPANRWASPITLRQLLSHRSGLPREAPVGHYLDDTAPSLERTIESLNRAEIVTEPGARVRYSNAGVALAGRIVETVVGKRFSRYAQDEILEPLGMKQSGFEPFAGLQERLAKGLLWTEAGRTFPAPVVELGTGPAGGLYTNVLDLGQFLMALFQGGKVVRKETLETMMRIVGGVDGQVAGRGLGFDIGELDSLRRVGHGGNIHGYSTQVVALPSERLGVAVMASRDFSGGVLRHAAEVSLRHLRAHRGRKPLPAITSAQILGREAAMRYEGTYQTGERAFVLKAGENTLWYQDRAGGPRVEVRQRDGCLVVDDRRQSGLKLVPKGTALEKEGQVYPRVPTRRPSPAPSHWFPYLGEYGSEQMPITVLEKDGRLQVNFSSLTLIPLTEISEGRFQCPEGSLFDAEAVQFVRDSSGKVTGLHLGTIALARRAIDGEDGRTFRIPLRRPIEELRREAEKATPPAQGEAFRKPDLVELTSLDPTIRLDLRYATENNFMGAPLYTKAAKAYLQRPAAEALVRAHKSLEAQGYGLLIHDAYRPWHVTRMFWEATPVAQRNFVADPSQGSRHNRGCAVDLTLYDRATGKPIEMVSGYDEFSDRAYPNYPGGTSVQRWHRELLRRAMESGGFTVYEAEWWHFDYRDWRHYAVLNERFETLAK